MKSERYVYDRLADDIKNPIDMVKGNWSRAFLNLNAYKKHLMKNGIHVRLRPSR